MPLERCKGSVELLDLQADMSAGRAKPGSQPGTDRLFHISDQVPVTTIVT